MSEHGGVCVANDDGDCPECFAVAERLRIAAWLHAKSDETEALLLLAADRAAPESRAVNQAFATKTRVILEVLARMIEKNVLPLTDRKARGDA